MMERALHFRLLIIGLGYTGERIAHATAAANWIVTGTSRSASTSKDLPHFKLIPHSTCAESLTSFTHLLITAPPSQTGDSTYELCKSALEAQNSGGTMLRWVGYMSTTSVYGDREGAEVDEDSEPKPGNERSKWRLLAEQQWATQKDRCAVDIFRIGGIYGPYRSAIEEVRQQLQSVRCIEKPGHFFSRIHVDDLVQAVIRAAQTTRPPGLRILHLVDDEPATQADVIREAAAILSLPPPPSVPFAEAVKPMNTMAKSFWAENRKVSSRKTKRELGIKWQYPSYREGLRACVREESEQDAKDTKAAV